VTSATSSPTNSTTNSTATSPTKSANSPVESPSPAESHKKAFLKTSKEKDASSSATHHASPIEQRRNSGDTPTAHSTHEKPRVPESPQNVPSLPFINVKRAARPQAKVPPRKATTLRVGKEAKQQQERHERMVELDDWHTMTLDGTVESAPSADDNSPRERLVTPGAAAGGGGTKAASAGGSPVGSPSGAAGVAAPISPSSSFIDSFKSKIGGLLQFKKPEPRQARFPLNEQSTSHKPPEVILEQIKKVLTSMDIPFLATSPFCYKCQTPTIGFEVEICRLPFLYLNGIRFRRIYGDAWEYTSTCKKILATLDLKNDQQPSKDKEKDKKK